jgi:hypothetical protein
MELLADMKLNKLGAASIAVYIVALFIIGVVIFTIIVLVFDVNFDTMISGLLQVFRSSGSSEPAIKAAIFQCDTKCSLIRNYDTNSLANSAFCTYFIEVAGEPNHCYNDYSGDVLVFNCVVTTPEGEEILVNNYCNQE